MIDTPGFGDRLIEEEKTIESLVQVTTLPQVIIECIISINFGREAHPSFCFYMSFYLVSDFAGRDQIYQRVCDCVQGNGQKDDLCSPIHDLPP